jgi:hypothetical protein
MLYFRQRQYAEKLSNWYHGRYQAAREQPVGRGDKFRTFRELDSQRRADRKERLARERAEREKVRAAHPKVTWLGFLEGEAAKGDLEARAALNRYSGPLPRTQTSVEKEPEQGHIASVQTEVKPPYVRTRQSRGGGIER